MMTARVFIWGTALALAGASAPGCNAITGVGDYDFHRACAQMIVAVTEDCTTEDVDENCDGVTRCSVDGLWAHGFGASGAQAGQAVAFDHGRNVIVAGTFQDQVALSASGDPLQSDGGDDIFVAKFDPSGRLLWRRLLHGAGDQSIGGLAIDGADNVILAGAFTQEIYVGDRHLLASGQDIFVAKLDAEGHDVWSKRFGDEGDQRASAVAVDGANHVLVTGSFMSTLDFGSGSDLLSSAGGKDLFIAKLTPAGEPVFSLQYGDTKDQAGTAIVAGLGGEFFVGGDFAGTLIPSADSPVASTGDADGFVLSFAADGTLQWAKGFGGGGNAPQRVTSMATDAEGSVLVAGTYEGGLVLSAELAQEAKGGVDMFLAKLGREGGGIAWAKLYGTPADEAPSHVAVDGRRNVVLAGTIIGPLDLDAGIKLGDDADVFVAKFDENGIAITTPRFVATGVQRSHAAAIDALGNIAVTGDFTGTVTFEDGVDITNVQPGAMQPDAFLAKFRP